MLLPNPANNQAQLANYFTPPPPPPNIPLISKDYLTLFRKYLSNLWAFLHKQEQDTSPSFLRGPIPYSDTGPESSQTTSFLRKQESSETTCLLRRPLFYWIPNTGMTKAISYALALFIIAAPAAAQTVTVSASGNCGGTATNCGTADKRDGDRDTTWPGLQVDEGDRITFTVSAGSGNTVVFRGTLSGSAYNSNDLTIVSGPISSFAPTVSGGTVGILGGASVLVFDVRSDGTNEGDEAVSLTLSTILTPGFTLSTPSSVTVTVRGTDTAPDFGTASVPNQVFQQNVAIDPLTIPEATGGNGPVTYTATTLPTGLSFQGACGARTLCGTPTDPTTAAQTVTITAADADSNTASSDTDTLMFTITVNPTVNISVTNNNGDRDSTWPGLQVDEGDRITFTVSAGSGNTVVFRGTLSGSAYNSNDLTIVSGPISSFAPTVSGGTVGILGGASVLVFDVRSDGTNEGDEAVSLTLSTILTPGFTLGTPSSATVTIRGTDTAPVFGTVADRTFFQGVSITEFQLPISGGNGPISYTASNLPAGLTLDNDGSGSCTSTEPGTICGTPTTLTTGAQTVTVTATDADSNTAPSDTNTSMFDITVVPHPIDLNNSGTLDANDALVLFRHYSGVPVTNEVATRADNWSSELGQPQGGDLNSDRSINQRDALIMYYAYEFGGLLNQSAVLRQLLLNGVRGRMPPTDTTYQYLLKRANRLR